MIEKKIGLALGGGAARGSAHVGVLQALDEHGIHIHCLSGTSIGAFVAALYAFKVPVKEIRGLAEKLSWRDVSEFTFSKLGLFKNEEIGNILRKYCGDVNIEDSPIPFAVVAANIRTGEKVVFKEGNLAKCVMASSAIPGIFIPVEIDGELLVDGALVENVPIDVLKSLGSNYTVAVNLHNAATYDRPKSIVDMVGNAFFIAIDAKTNLQLEEANLRLDINLSGCARLDNEHSLICIQKGYAAGLLAAKKLKPVQSHSLTSFARSFFPKDVDQKHISM
ncbi:MAG: patatin-like phospholipase family protein [Bdellovibrionales bacterium]|nr:patatin-like phospholipase family protein [Bdellovibrionales bacterium]